jgi:general secretion pathway protein I
MTSIIGREKETGFTLLEVLVALTILSISVIFVIQLFAANLRSLSISEEYVHAAMKGEEKMSEVTLNPDLDVGAWSDVTGEGYSINGIITEVMGERTEELGVRLLKIDMTIEWKGRRAEKSISLSTMKAVKKKAVR